MKVLILYDNSGPKYHRLLLPCYLMPGVELVVSNVLNDDICKDVDVLFFNRVISNMSIYGVLEFRQRHGFKIIVDFDDHWELGPDHYLYQSYRLSGASKVMEEWIKLADAVTVTHERLADEVKPLNENVHILPNAIPYWGQFSTPKQADEKIRLFWAGGITHKKDLEILKRPLQLIKRDKVKFVLGGYVEGNPEWKAMAKCFTTNSTYNTDVLEALPVESYYAMYSKCDIALIPLLKTKFNSHKSNLKILEAANNSSPVIVSRVHPYLGFPEDLVNYVDLHNTWYSQIKKLTGNPELVKEQGQALKEYCDKHFNFAEINLKRKQLFYETIQQGKPGEIQKSAANEVRLFW